MIPTYITINFPKYFKKTVGNINPKATFLSYRQLIFNSFSNLHVVFAVTMQVVV